MFQDLNAVAAARHRHHPRVALPLAMCLLASPFAATFGADGQVQQVTIEVTCEDLAGSTAKLQFEVPRSCSVEVRPWAVLISKRAPHHGRPIEIEWTANVPFEIEFDKAHFASKRIKAAEKAGGKFSVKSGPVTMDPDALVNALYHYTIVAWPKKPTPAGKTEEERGRAKAMLEAQEHKIVIDPDYIIEDGP